MDFKTFLEKMKERGFGVVSFNTYDKHFEDETWTFCFLMIAEKGNEGRFMKQECRIDSLEIMLEAIMLNIDNTKTKSGSGEIGRYLKSLQT